MLNKIKSCISLVFFAVCVAEVDHQFVTQEKDTQPLGVAVKAYKVELDADGEEVLVSSEEALPKDKLRVVATYSNNGEKVLKDVQPELLVPEGTEYVEDSIKPEPSQVKIGEVFLAWPLSEEILKDHTHEDFIGFRWLIAELTSEEEVKFEFDISVK